MDFSKKLRDEMPSGATMETEYTLDGDIIPTAVKYKTASGQEKKVKMVWTPDGDRIPETGYTASSHFNWQKIFIKYCFKSKKRALTLF